MRPARALLLVSLCWAVVFAGAGLIWWPLWILAAAALAMAAYWVAWEVW